MIQFKSEGVKHGESPSHIHARQVLTIYLRAKGKTIMADNTFKFPEEFITEHKLRRSRQFMGHSFDIMTIGKIIEIDDDFDSKHSKKSQKINDGIAQSFAEKYLSAWKFYRVQKHEINKLDTCYEYLEEALR